MKKYNISGIEINHPDSNEELEKRIEVLEQITKEQQQQIDKITKLLEDLK